MEKEKNIIKMEKQNIQEILKTMNMMEMMNIFIMRMEIFILGHLKMGRKMEMG